MSNLPDSATTDLSDVTDLTGAGEEALPAGASPHDGSTVQTTQNQGQSSATPDATKPKTDSSHPKQTTTPLQGADARVEVRIVVPEGFTFMQIAKRLEENGVCSAKDFYYVAQNYQVKSFHIPNNPDRCFRMEGYLFPDTYVFYQNTDPQEVLVRMLNRYAESSGMPTEQELILASMIEKEARSWEHRTKVSAVYHNRLRLGNMTLDCDPTREYILNDIRNNSLVKNPDKYPNLYNTYNASLKGRLPVGPICNPGRESIRAAQNPANIPSLYFYFDGTTNRYFNDYDAFQASIMKFPADTGRA